jgi:hypothetical protein
MAEGGGMAEPEKNFFSTMIDCFSGWDWKRCPEGNTLWITVVVVPLATG